MFSWNFKSTKRSKRIEELRERIISYPHSVSSERARIITDSYKETEGLPIVIRRAKAFEKILNKMKIEIRRGELIVGNFSDKLLAVPIFPEFSIDWVEQELEKFSKRPIETFRIDYKVKRELRGIFNYWKGKTHKNRVNSLISLILPDKVLKYYDFEGEILNQVNSIGAHTSSGEGHIIPDYEVLLKKGLIGTIEEAKSEIIKLDITKPENLKKELFLQAVIISCNAAIQFAIRFSDEAMRLSLITKDTQRRVELQKIARICKKVPANGATSFWEALQLVWFIHFLVQIESNGHGVSLGRFDQYLFQFYKKDIERGEIKKDGALELLECFYIKCNEILKLRCWSFTQYVSGYQTFQTLTLGGQTVTGEDATNELSYLCLEATAITKLTHPTTVVRIHKNTSKEFLLESCKTLIAHGGGLPGFFNDEIAIPSLLSKGVSLEDARNWAVVGCSEIVVPGKFNSVTGGCNHVNLLKILELSLNNGVNRNNGSKLCPGDGNLTEFKSFNEILSAYKRQLNYYLNFVPVLDNITASAYAELNPTPFLSALIDSRIKSAKDITEGRGLNYNDTLVQGHGVVNVGNSLASIKKCVFDKKMISLTELKEALDNDFETTQRNRETWNILLKAPKYGNDDDYVDLIVKETTRYFLDEIDHLPSPIKGGWYAPTLQTVSANVPQGMNVGATPGGRKAGEPLADNISPAPGSDLKGPTATLKSVSKLDHMLITNGSILNLKFHPAVLKGREKLEKFAVLIKTFFDLGGFQVQFNIVSAETLKEAQKNPDSYRNLMVKVAGYSALFGTLDKKLQDQIITRTEHVL